MSLSVCLFVFLLGSFQQLPGRCEAILCYVCENCYIPTNLVECPDEKQKCGFEHIAIIETKKEIVKRTCAFKSYPSTCDQMTTNNLHIFVCRCNFSLCNGHKIAIGPKKSQRFFEVPYQVAVVDPLTFSNGAAADQVQKKLQANAEIAKILKHSIQRRNEIKDIKNLNNSQASNESKVGESTSAKARQ